MASGTASPDAVGIFRPSSVWRSPRAPSASWTRIGIWRSPTSNLARFIDTSPMVAMRTASEIASVETPRLAATSGLGLTRSSGRSSSAVETTLSSAGSRRACAVRSAPARLTASPSRPVTTSWNWRWPLSCRNQKRMSGTLAKSRPTASLNSAWVVSRSSLGASVMMKVALRTSLPVPSSVPPLTNTERTSGRSRMRIATPAIFSRVSARRVPGGSSRPSSRRPVSSAGRKPDGSR